MGESDIYCAFCSGPMLRSRIEFSKRKGPAPTEKIQQHGTSADGDANIDDDSCGSDEEDEDDCSLGYNLNILSPKDVAWITTCRCLALNMERFKTDGIGRAFISGYGTPDGMGYFNVDRKDPSDTGALEHSCYWAFESGETSAFPFHDACYEIFARSLMLTDTEAVDNDVLYDVMESYRTEATLSCLDLDYRYHEGADQFWQCVSGLEYCVADPSPAPGTSAMIRDSMPQGFLRSEPSTFDFSQAVRSDPLDVLPYDVIHSIVEHLDINDTLALRQASWHVFDWTRRDRATFGKQMIRLHLSPWFWEVDEYVSNISDVGFDFTRFFLWLEAITGPTIGMSGPFMGIANRWRIWDTCQPLVHDHQERVDAR